MDGEKVEQIVIEQQSPPTSPEAEPPSAASRAPRKRKSSTQPKEPSAESKPEPKAKAKAEPKKAKPLTKAKAASNKSKPKKASTKSKGNGKDEVKLTPAEKALDVRPGTNKAKLLAFLMDHQKVSIPKSRLVRAVYGNDDKKSNGAFSMCLGGLQKTIKAKRWGDLKMEKGKDSKEVSFVFETKS